MRLEEDVTKGLRGLRVGRPPAKYRGTRPRPPPRRRSSAAQPRAARRRLLRRATAVRLPRSWGLVVCVAQDPRTYTRTSDLAFRTRGTPAALLALRSTCCALATCLMEELVVRFGSGAGKSGRETSIRLLLPAFATVTDLKCHLNATGWPVGPDQTVRTPGEGLQASLRCACCVPFTSRTHPPS